MNIVKTYGNYIKKYASCAGAHGIHKAIVRKAMSLLKRVGLNPGWEIAFPQSCVL